MAGASDRLDGTGVGFFDSWGMTTISGFDVITEQVTGCECLLVDDIGGQQLCW